MSTTDDTSSSVGSTLTGNQPKQKKCSITQSQKHNKRQRATPDQLDVLTAEFELCKTPSAEKRTEIGELINMTERSVQIWFQNRRAKLKKEQEKRIFLQGPQTSITRVGPTLRSSIEASDDMPHLTNVPSVLSLIPDGTISIPCTTLQIGGWSRSTVVDPPSPDLTVYYDPSRDVLVYIVYSNGTIYKIERPLCALLDAKIHAVSPEETNATAEISLTFDLMRSETQFYYMSIFHMVWLNTSDFTELQQVSFEHEHQLRGELETLRESFLKIAATHPNKLDQVLWDYDNTARGLSPEYTLDKESLALDQEGGAANATEHMENVLSSEGADISDFLVQYVEPYVMSSDDMAAQPNYFMEECDAHSGLQLDGFDQPMPDVSSQEKIAPRSSQQDDSPDQVEDDSMSSSAD